MASRVAEPVLPLAGLASQLFVPGWAADTLKFATLFEEYSATYSREPL